MSLIILHGEHEVNSRAELASIIQQFSEKQMSVVRLEADTSLQPAVLEQELGSIDMFGGNKGVFIERLHSLLKSKRKDELIDIVVRFSEQTPIVLWENKKLTATQLKKFPKAEVTLFSLSPVIFQWVESIHLTPTQKLKLLHSALKQDGAEFCFAMLVRQVRQLLLLKSGTTMKDAPWTLKKLHTQAKSFSLDQLKYMHDKLTHIDYAQKTGQAKLTLDQELQALMVAG